jgi:glycosyltransferase 2 family protein
MRHPVLRFALKVLFSLILLAVLLYTVDLAEIWQAARNMQPGLLLLAVSMFFPTQLFNAYRWYFLLQTLGARARYRSVVRYTLLGQFSALFLPGQISGDIVRATAIAHKDQQYAQSFLSLILDKLTFLFAISLFALIGAQASPVLSIFPGLVLASAAIGMLSLVGVALFATYRDSRPLQWFLEVWPGMPKIVAGLLRKSIEAFTIPGLGAPVIIWTLVCALGLQALNTFGSFILARSMHLMVNPLDWMALNAVVAVAQILPISVGGLGVREGAFVFLLSFYGVSAPQALAFSLVTFILVALLVTLGWMLAELFGMKKVGDSHLTQPPG